mgnify:CR=1 FL=1
MPSDTRPGAFARLTTTSNLSPEAAWAAANLPNDLPSILPKTASGKIRRAQLRTEAL